MAKTETFIISRQEIRRVLIAYNIPDKNMEQLLSAVEKAHRHINAIALSGLLEKAGLNRDQIINMFRRIGMDDVTIRDILDSADEQRVLSESGRLFNVSIDFG